MKSHVSESIYVGSTVVLMGRMYDTTDSLLTLADIVSVTVRVSEVVLSPVSPSLCSSVSTIADPYATPAKEDVFFDTLQTDTRWIKAKGGDSTGYNMAYKFVPAKANTTYDVRIEVVDSVGDTSIAGFTVPSI